VEERAVNILDEAFNRTQIRQLQTLMDKIHWAYYQPAGSIIDGVTREEYIDELIVDLDRLQVIH
jgi:hypothetical protein